MAVARNGVIGRDGGLPWRMPSDLKTFRRLTLGKPVVMGRATFQSIGKPLDGRDNIVVTRDRTFQPPGVIMSTSVEAALDIARVKSAATNADEIMVIGGGQIYAATLGQADRIYLTEIDATPEGDAHFPVLDPQVWREMSRTPIPRSEKDDHAAELVMYDRAKA